jgi:hypothetical protein
MVFLDGIVQILCEPPISFISLKLIAAEFTKTVLQLSLGSNFHSQRCNLRDPPGVAFDWKILFNPVTEFGSRRQHDADFDERGFNTQKCALESSLWLWNCISKDVTDCAAHKRFGWNADVHGDNSIVNKSEAVLVVQHR